MYAIYVWLVYAQNFINIGTTVLAWKHYKHPATIIIFIAFKIISRVN